jgi:hypothetical protein
MVLRLFYTQKVATIFIWQRKMCVCVCLHVLNCNCWGLCARCGQIWTPVSVWHDLLYNCLPDVLVHHGRHQDHLSQPGLWDHSWIYLDLPSLDLSHLHLSGVLVYLGTLIPVFLLGQKLALDRHWGVSNILNSFAHTRKSDYAIETRAVHATLWAESSPKVSGNTPSYYL